MEQLLVRNVDERLKRNIKKAAERNGRSMQAEVLETLKREYAGEQNGGSLLGILGQMRDDLGNEELELPKRSKPRPVPAFE